MKRNVWLLSGAMVCSLGVGTHLWARANAADVPADCKAMVDKWKNLFQTLAHHSEQHHPPGINAANGHFHRVVMEEAANGEYYRLREKERPSSADVDKLSWEAKQLWGAFAVFYDDVIGSSEAKGDNCFRNQGNFESSKPAGQKALATATIIVQILSAGDSDDKKKNDAQAAALAKAASDYQREFNDTDQIRGAHMNGHISKGVKGAAQRVQDSLKADIFDKPGVNKDIRRVAEIINETMKALKELQTDGHDPWLRGDWQIQFQVICRAAGTQLHNIRVELYGEK